MEIVNISQLVSQLKSSAKLPGWFEASSIHPIEYDVKKWKMFECLVLGRAHVEHTNFLLHAAIVDTWLAYRYRQNRAAIYVRLSVKRISVTFINWMYTFRECRSHSVCELLATRRYLKVCKHR